MDQSRLSGPARTGDLLGGRYRLEELIGEGGMGSVWRASDATLRRKAAVKVFRSGATDGIDAARRESEKKLLASVSHPSLVTLYDAHLVDDELSYLVMEYIDGGTLSGVLARGPVTPRDAASLAADLGEALHVVHGAGIVHRDVKPANILLRPPLTPDHTFRAVLADFGIAYVVDATRVTTPGMAIGTAAYISPEQVRGHAPTPASDIYSLGLVLLEALSGRRAFAAQTPVEAISVRLVATPEIPGDWGYGWRSLLSAMTALDPDARPTALEVSTRGRELDTDSASLAATRLVEVVTAPVPAQADASRREQTRMLPVGASDAATLLGGAADPTASARRSTRRRAAMARRRKRGVGGAIIAAAAGVIGLTTWFGAAGSVPSPTEAPRLERPADVPSSPTPGRSTEPPRGAEPVIAPVPVPVEVSAPAPVSEPVVDPVAPVESGVTVSGEDPENAGPGNNSGSQNAGPGNNNGKGKGNSG